MLQPLIRLAGAGGAALLGFAIWLVVLLSRMPSPPVPPSYAVTLTGAVVVAIGYTVGLLLGERFTQCEPTRPRSLLLWCLAGCAAGATLLFPFGGMMAGFGILGFGATTVAAWEVRRRKRNPRR